MLPAHLSGKGCIVLPKFMCGSRGPENSECDWIWRWGPFYKETNEVTRLDSHPL